MRNQDEASYRVQCILKHVSEMRRDGLPNSLGHLNDIEQDARALEDLFLGEDTSQPVHLD